MAYNHGMDVPKGKVSPATAAAVAVVVAFGALGAGTGFSNGDAAVYAFQASRGDFSERLVHVGYLAAAWLVAQVAGAHLALALDVVMALCAGGVVALTAHLASRLKGAPSLAAWGAASVVLPLASFAEVDLPWVLCAVGAAAVPSRVAAAGLVAAAIAVSPTAALSVGWVVVVRAMIAAEQAGNRDAFPHHARAEARVIGVGALVAVAALTIGTEGAWWTGDRGVLSGPHLAPDRTLHAWLTGAANAGLVLAAGIGALRSHRGGRMLLAAAPLLLAPPDVPAWVPCGLSVVLVASYAPSMAGLGRALAWAGVAAAVVLSIGRWDATRVRIQGEERMIQSVVDALGPDDLVVAPWSLGVRTSLAAVDDPYALAWRTPGAPVRDQAARTCASVYTRIAVLPAGASLPGVPAWTVDAAGVHWADGGTFPYGALPGCR